MVFLEALRTGSVNRDPWQKLGLSRLPDSEDEGTETAKEQGLTCVQILLLDPARAP